MPSSEAPKPATTLVVEFRGERANFQSAAHRARVAGVHRAADSLQARAAVSQEQLRVRAKL